MGYFLGIDFGTTFTAAAIWRDGRGEMVQLGDHGLAVPTVLYVDGGGSVLVGEPATRRALTEPHQTAREFKRRFGDPTPMIIGGTPYSVDALAAKVYAWVVKTVTAREGGKPDGITVTHPANWGPYKHDLLRQAARRAGLGDVDLRTEPEAAALYYASAERVPIGARIAVYDLGGGTFDAAILSKTVDGFEVLGRPEGIEHLGGVDFDEALFNHVCVAADTHAVAFDASDLTSLTSVAQLRKECVAAKEALSADTDAVITTDIGGSRAVVRVVRAEFEDMIRPLIMETIEAVLRTINSAGITFAELDMVLPVGGSSRIPLVTGLLSDRLGRPIAGDVNPTHAVALGAALAASDWWRLNTTSSTAAQQSMKLPQPAQRSSEQDVTPAGPPPRPPQGPRLVPSPTPAKRVRTIPSSRQRILILGVLAGTLAFIAGVLVWRPTTDNTAHTVANMAAAPCTALSGTQVQELGLRGSGEPRETTCEWGPGPILISVSRDVDTLTTAESAAGAGGTPTVLHNRRAIVYRPLNSPCTIVVRTDWTSSITVYSPSQDCEQATKVAEAVISNLI